MRRSITELCSLDHVLGFDASISRAGQVQLGVTLRDSDVYTWLLQYDFAIENGALDYQADFTSYDPTYLGQPAGRRLQIPHPLIRHVEAPRIESDKVCPQCNRRLAFLRFVVQMRIAV